MARIEILSWNVNGIRAAEKKGFVEWLERRKPDILCIQETKSQPEQLSASLKEACGYRTYWHSAEKKGYSGVAAYCRIEPQATRTEFGAEILSREGRTLLLEFADFVLLCVYFPNGKRDEERLRYKMDFYEAFLALILELQKSGKPVVFCGDVNTAHKEIDLARPKENRKISGFLPAECAWLDRVVERGFFDTFRAFHEEAGKYTWWDLQSKARERNVGWRIDYFFAHESLRPRIHDAYILPEVEGSDHCPVGISLETSLSK